jgi:hypothetical protein
MNSAWIRVHFHPVSGVDFVLLIVNAIVCGAIFGLLVFPSTVPGTTTAVAVRWFRLMLACVYGWVTLLIVTGHYLTPVEPAELMANMVTLAIVWAVHGDMQVLADALKDARRRRAKLRREARAHRGPGLLERLKSSRHRGGDNSC